jgi:hypothetical protein
MIPQSDRAPKLYIMAVDRLRGPDHIAIRILDALPKYENLQHPAAMRARMFQMTLETLLAEAKV